MECWVNFRSTSISGPATYEAQDKTRKDMLSAIRTSPYPSVFCPAFHMWRYGAASKRNLSVSLSLSRVRKRVIPSCGIHPSVFLHPPTSQPKILSEDVKSKLTKYPEISIGPLKTPNPITHLLPLPPRPTPPTKTRLLPRFLLLFPLHPTHPLRPLLHRRRRPRPRPTRRRRGDTIRRAGGPQGV